MSSYPLIDKIKTFLHESQWYTWIWTYSIVWLYVHNNLFHEMISSHLPSPSNIKKINERMLIVDLFVDTRIELKINFIFEFWDPKIIIVIKNKINLPLKSKTQYLYSVHYSKFTVSSRCIHTDQICIVSFIKYMNEIQLWNQCCKFNLPVIYKYIYVDTRGG